MTEAATIVIALFCGGILGALSVQAFRAGGVIASRISRATSRRVGRLADDPRLQRISDDAARLRSSASQHIFALSASSQMWPGTPRTDGPNHIGMPSQTIQQPAGADWRI